MLRHFKLLMTGLALAASMEAAAQEWTKAASMSPVPQLPLAAFAQLGRFDSPSLSLDGKRIAYLTSINGRKHVVIKPLDPALGQAAVVRPPDKDFEFRWLMWGNNERILVGLGAALQRGFDGYLQFEDRTRETRLLSIRFDGKDIVNMYKPVKLSKVGSRLGEVTSQTNVVRQDNVIDVTPKDPDTFLLSAYNDLVNDTGTTVRKVNINTGAYSIFAPPKSGIYHQVTDLNSEIRLGFGEHIAGNTIVPFVSYRDPDTGSWTETKNSPINLESVYFLEFTQNPLFAYVIAPVDGRQSLVKYNMRTHKNEEVLVRDPFYDVSSAIFGNNRSLIGVRLTNKKEVVLDKSWQGRMSGLKKALAPYQVYLVDISEDGQFALVFATSPDEPGIYYIYNVAKKTLEPVEYAYAGLGPDNAALRVPVKYKARDGLEIEAFLTMPRGKPAKNLPTIILPHGGPFGVSDDANYDYESQFLANRGYAVLQPNFRGSGGYGEAFIDKGNGQWGLAMQDDLTDGVAWMVQNGIADKNRICIVGGSYGGYAALMGAVKTPDLFKCAASVNGVFDIVALLRDDYGRYKSEYAATRIGDVDKDREKLKATSPINNVDKIKIPVLLIHAKNDLRVDIRQSYRMRDKLKAAGKPVEFVELANGEHFLETEASRVAYLTALEAFLAKNLGN